MQFLYDLFAGSSYVFMWILTIGFVCLAFYLLIWLPFLRNWFHSHSQRKLNKKLDEQQEQDTYLHSEHWDYIKDLIPWQTRAELNKLRGDKDALSQKIKHFSASHGIGPKVADWILEEYMITTRTEDLPTAPKTWTCPKCGAKNPHTALFCKDCGEYK